MRCIVGLGNPGKKYENNRHNVGFMMIDYIVDQIQNSKFKIDKHLNSELYILNSKLILVKPQTFMNLSGQAVKKIVTSYELRVTNDLIVVHDDLDIPLGKFRLDFARGPKLHNGIESIEQHLKTKDFWRVRIGVDNRLALRSPASPAGRLGEGGFDGKARRRLVPGEAYVLQNFRQEEREVVTKLFPKIWRAIKSKT